MRLDMRSLFVAFTGAVALAVCSIPAQATTVLYNNLSAPEGPLYYANAFINYPFASFSTGSTPITLTDVQLSLYVHLNVDPLAAVSLWSDSNTAPGTLLDVLDPSLSVSGSTPTVYDIGSLSILLAANTRYWISVVQQPNQGCCNAIYWSQAQNDSGIGVSSEYYNLGGYIPGGGYPSIVGSTLQYGTTSSNSSTGTPLIMEVQGVTAVPEPPVLPLFAIGFLAMAFLGRRRFAR